MDEGVEVDSGPAEGVAAFSPETQVAIARERENVAALQSLLAARAPHPFITATVSARVPNEPLFVITPASGDRSPEDVILADLAGAPVPHTPGWENPPTATIGTHAQLYQERDEVGGIAELVDGAGGVGPMGLGADADAAVASALESATTHVPGSDPGEVAP